MRHFKTQIIILALSAFFLSACTSAVMVGDRVVGVRSGKFFYTDGTLKTDYGVPFEIAWNASEKALLGVNATILDKEKKISSGTYNAHMEGEDVRVVIEYIEQNLTMISVRVGLTGNNLASKLIHDRIREALSQP